MKTNQKKITGYIFLNLSCLLAILLPIYFENTLSNFVILILVLFGSLIAGSLTFSKLNLAIAWLAMFLYMINPGPLKLFVPVIPLLGFFIYIEPIRIQKLVNFGIVISVLTLFLISISGHYGYGQGLNLVNRQSEIFVYVIILNLIFFRHTLTIPVFVAVSSSIIFNPGGVGNRSAAFLLFFVLSKENIKKYWSKLSKLKVTTIMFLALLCFVAAMILYKLIENPKFSPDYEEQRLLWIGMLIQYFLDNGILAFWDDAEHILPNSNPHNSFAYLLMYETLVGLYKVVIFIYSIFLMPLSSWLAILLRGSFDSFFYVGPLGIIFSLLVTSYLKHPTNNMH